MRQEIETAPRDGKDILLQDDAKVAYDVAHWSSEAGGWVWKSGEPVQITPTHWYPVEEDEPSRSPSQPGGARRRLGTISIVATLLAAALIGGYFRSEMVA